MKSFVSKEMKAGAVLGAIVAAIAFPLHASASVVYLLAFVLLAAYALIETKPPWLRRTPLGRWFRR